MEIQYNRKLNTEEMVLQGNVSFGSYPQSTVLGSCVSVILLSERQRIGGLSHIVGHNTGLGKYNLPEEAIGKLREYERGLGINDPNYLLVGGSD